MTRDIALSIASMPGMPLKNRHWRGFRSKGALILLVWNGIFMSSTVALFRFYDSLITSSDNNIAIPYIVYGGLILHFLPAMAADLWLGRHRVMMWGTTIIWCALIIFSMAEALSVSIPTTVLWFYIVVLNLCRALFEANVVQFGADQLPEASSDELSSFIHWFIFSRFLGETGHFFLCYLLKRFVPPIWSPLTLTITFSLLLVLLNLYCFNTEPPKKYAYRSIYLVLKYAWKNKFPQRRAYMYWDEKLPSRIDLGKCHNGGPFHSEEVEDVKMFLKILGVLLLLAGLTGVGSWFSYVSSYLMFLHSGESLLSMVSDVALHEQIPSITALVYVLLHELIAIPFFRRYTPNILKRLWLSALAFLLGSVSYLLIDALGHRVTLSSVECMFHYNYTNMSISTLHISPYYSLIPSIFDALAFILSYISILEFILSQSPLAFQGLLISLILTFLGTGFSISHLVAFLLQHLMPDSTEPKKLSCGSSYFLLSAGMGVFVLLLLTVIIYKYKYRQREQPSSSLQQKILD